nr:hypothetical protein [uncultured Cohaesibacter sp.]
MNWIVEQIAKPVVRRVGTVVGTYLAAKSVPADYTEAIVDGLMASALVGIDLAMSYRARTKRSR